ncbi:tetratricopeptide repeat protein [Planotetraspora sp. A-T 1434]|uniref:BTAD domain-containing putative transcriptional regulator n=1 Tax=Planotetraspora sp. A-T 1434 TaxID=2979219 RepID=UPI0021C08E01|nr:BTAD domain-containing putative transcriptional regulator [Planotetraspora sp. A-T 1434]MCT9933441.1 tetratricopeptide repeat protein [Planotetraspora sp. A-T 1434]
MRFGILGTTRAWHDDGSEAPIGGATRRALLALLLVRPGEVVTADRLVHDLYGEQATSGAAHALQSQVSRLRQALRHHAPIELAPGGYRLAVDPGDVDAHRFERLADAGRHALRNGRPGEAAALLREALALWRGPALADAGQGSRAAGPGEGDSIQAEIVRLEEHRLAALEDRIEADLQLGEHRAVVPELQELAGRHPLRERLRGLLMRALQADGRQAEALVVFEETRRLLADELGADPSAELAEIHQALLRGDRLFEPPSLPAQLTSFVGRADDLARVGELLATTRLVTLLGPGGAGKTRLSIEVAGREPDVCFVELAPLRDLPRRGGGPEVAQAVLGALGLREGGLLALPGETTPASRLVAALADRPLLLVLDNCEHVVEAAAALAERLLAGCRNLRVLATSREPLGITGENLWPVRALSPSAAARLFADRAAAVRPGFAVDDSNADAVRHVCRALDGLPLAIELAAARMRTHDAAELAARLGDRFRLLSRGSRTAQARHQTLRAVVAWSWDLLSEDEQVMARRLTVFSGGATAEAAERVCAVPGAEDVLDSLADKSLVEVGNGRFRMLETIRAYCAEQLDAAGESDAVRRAHAEHFLALAEDAGPRLRRSEQIQWLEILAAEHENLQAALRWAVDAGEAELGLRLLASLSSYLWIRGLRTWATGQAVALLDLVGTEPPPGLGEEYVFCALTAAASAAGRKAWNRSRQVAERLVVAPDRGHRHPIITLLWPMLTAGEGDPSVALSVMTRGGAGPDPWERALVELSWGYPQFAAGDFAQAERQFAMAADVFRSLGDRWGTAFALDALATVADICGDATRAITLIDEALTLTEELGAVEDLPDLLVNRGDYRSRGGSARVDMGGGDVDGGDLAGARADYEKAAEIARRAGSLTYLAAALRGLGDIARQEGDLPEAARLYEEALERFDPHWVKSVGNRAGALIGLGKVAEASGDLAEARDRYRQAVEVVVTVGPLPGSARAVEALAGVALAEGDAVSAAELLGAATALRGVATGSDPEAARVAAAAQAILGESPYGEAYRKGMRLAPEDALRLAGVPDAVILASPISAVIDLGSAGPGFGEGR